MNRRLDGRKLGWGTALGLVAGALLLAGGPPAACAEQEAEGAEHYRIGVEDVLEINVWKNPDVSRQVWVRPDGRITVPLAGEMLVRGLTVQEVAEGLTGKLKEFFTEPVVTVTLLETNSYNVYLLGRVGTPGIMKLRSPKTVLQVLAMAGGFQEFASTGNIVVTRMVEGKSVRIPVDVPRIIKRGDQQDFLLLPGDVVVVP
ncbi:MAG: polysaccharide biosynthesis/export family protein [Thermodesulfobacteriota bacterium]